MRRPSTPISTAPAPAQTRAQCQHGCDQCQCQPEFRRRQVTPNFLDRSEIGHSLLSCGADAREPHQLAETICANTPVSTAINSQATDVPVPGMLGNVATIARTSVPTNSNQANVQPVYEVLCQRRRGRDPRQHSRAKSTRS